MRDLFRLRDFRLLWLGHATSSFGDAVTSLALLLTAQRLTGSVAAVATTGIAVALPQLLFGFVAGAYADRVDRRRLMIASDLARGVLVLGFVLVGTADQMWLLYTIAFLQAAVGTFFDPARSAFLPALVGPDRLLAANSATQGTEIVFALVGTAFAGVFVGLSGALATLFVIDSVTFIASAGLETRIRTAGTPARTADPSTVWSELRDGLVATVRSPLLAGVMIGGLIVMFGLGAVNVLLVPFIVDTLSVSETWFGALEGSQVLSMVLAAALVAALARRFRPTTMISAGLTGVGLLVAAISLVSTPWHLMLVLFGVGWFVSPLQASLATLTQQEVPDEVRGRVNAALNTVMTIGGVASMALAGVAATLLGVRGVFALSGAIAVGAGLLTVLLFQRATVRTTVGAHVVEGAVAGAEIGAGP